MFSRIQGVKELNGSDSDKITMSLYNIVNEYIRQNELRDMVLQFVNYQSEKGFPFGELLVLHYHIFSGADTEEIYAIAAAVELLILSFDILDDFEDEDTKDKPWSTDSKLALNATTALLFISIKVIKNTSFKNKNKILDILEDLALQSINGQHKDLLNICKTESEYIEMSIEKSGSLVALACLAGAVLARNDYPVEIDSYSKYIGLIGQINNDLMDIKNWNGKNDLLHKKYSLPIIFLLNCGDKEIQFIHNYYQNKVNKSEIIKNQELINQKLVETGAIIYTEVIKTIYQNKTMNEIQQLDIEQRYLEKLLKYIF